MRTQVDTTQRKTKANNLQKKSSEDPIQKGLTGYKMPMNDDKEDLR
jgi:hypothetical protein